MKPLPPVIEENAFLSKKTWMRKLRECAVKSDVTNAKAIVIILEGVEKIEEQAGNPQSVALSIAELHVFQQLEKTPSQAKLLREAGVLYLRKLDQPTLALKHFDLALSLDPQNQELEGLRRIAIETAVIKISSGQTGPILNPPSPDQPTFSEVIRRTSSLRGLSLKGSQAEARELLNRKLRHVSKTSTFSPGVPANDLPPAPILQAGGEATAIAPEVTSFEPAKAEAESVDPLPPEEKFAQLGLAAYERGDYKEALAAYDKARDSGGTSFQSYFNCGIVREKMGDFAGALPFYLEAVKRAPENAKVWCGLASLHFHQGNLEKAEDAARRSLALKPTYGRAWDNLASVLSAQNRLDEAAKACQEAIRLQPAIEDPWFKLGVIYFQQDNIGAADEAFRFVAENPKYQSYILFYFSMISARKGDLEQAKLNLDAARVLDPKNDLEFFALRELAQTCTRFNLHAEACAYYSELTQRLPEDFAGWLALGAACHRAKDFRAAEIAYFRANEITPESPLPWHNLALLATEQADHAQASAYFQEEVSLAPKAAKAWYDLGLSLEKLGRTAESQAALQRAEKLVKEQSRTSTDLSVALGIVRRLSLKERSLHTA